MSWCSASLSCLSDQHGVFSRSSKWVKRVRPMIVIKLETHGRETSWDTSCGSSRRQINRAHPPRWFLHGDAPGPDQSAYRRIPALHRQDGVLLR
ncbi:hypothetical protein HMPREF0290_0164 [Corynebacterium efficiens YS-314]|nr:hypothetical protein HMPREF0290_0164 [Corynebacterium efficiens YS-314]